MWRSAISAGAIPKGDSETAGTSCAERSGRCTHMGIHPQRVFEVRAEELVQWVGRREAALRGDDVGLGAGVGAQVVRHQLVHRAVQAAERRLHPMPHLHSVCARVTGHTLRVRGQVADTGNSQVL